MFYCFMFTNFPEHAAVTTADDEYMFGFAVCQYGYMAKHFVVDELVRLRGLNNAIQRHYAAEFCVLENDQVLMLCFILEVELVNAKFLPVTVVQGFGVRLHCSALPRNSSYTFIL